MVFVAYESVLSRGMVLGVIITKVGCSWSQKQLPLGASVFHPVEAHVDGLGPLLLQVFVSKLISCGIVHLYPCWGLWVYYFYKSFSFRDRVLCIYKRCPNFCHCRQRHDICHYFSYIVNGSIVWGVFSVVTEIMIVARSDVRLRHLQLQGVAVQSQNRLAMFVLDECCWVDGGLI